jgi:predicted alpha/beta-hydrolase family hydrolase
MATAAIERIERDGVRGFLHRPDAATGQSLVLTHGAGGDCDTPLLRAIADAFAAAGLLVLRFDLAFRQRKPSGPPSPSGAAADRDSIRAAGAMAKNLAPGPLFIGGQSYGGRQASMLAAEAPQLAAALLLTSYPLHPPGKPTQLRTAHFPKLRTRCVIVHGTADPFASSDELAAAVALIPAPTKVLSIEGAGHDLKRGRFDLSAMVAALLDRA